MPEQVDHDMWLAYTTADDGIWLYCTCGHEDPLGFNPSPATVAERATAHAEESR